MLILPTFVVSLVLALVRAMLAVAFARECVIKLKDVSKFARNDGLPVPVAWSSSLLRAPLRSRSRVACWQFGRRSV